MTDIEYLLGAWERGADAANYSTEIEALRQALAQPEQEPVAWITRRTGDGGVVISGYETCEPTDYDSIPVYTAPPKREWVGLTDNERNEMIGRIQHDQFTRQRDLIGKTQIITEMYLKERNT
ncbi:hypothetical protein UFOVP172_38 [uncultured Caudovirales phage]|uniref:Uncharacterized protein n=1 Tax=uncultured Caudovirales phage TaxID=2100421 RepID=A0A6J7WCF8_9CAUD|nr:hypothetical protein UFOVP172_38 [uncultured Caudovirales phage]